MSIRPILRYTDPRLREPAIQVTLFDQLLADLARDLEDTMRDAPALGITGPHIGIGLAVAAIALDEQPAQFFVNPEVIEVSAELARNLEGSVSMAGVTEEVERPASVTVSFQDLSGTRQTITAEGLMAVCLQHEIDQINGIFWLQRLSRLKRERVTRRFEKFYA